jgi:hypothetical protein
MLEWQASQDFDRNRCFKGLFTRASSKKVFFVVTYGPKRTASFGDFSASIKPPFGKTSNHAPLSPFKPLSTHSGESGA